MVDLKAEIERVVREHLADSAIDAVRVTEEVDDDNDRFFKVTVVYSSKKLDANKMKGLVRHLRSALADDYSYTFPLVSYRTKKDDMRHQAAAA